MPKHISLIVAVALATACTSACSNDKGNTGSGTGGPPVQLPACQAWPEAQGPAFSFPQRWPSAFESVRRAANGQTLYGVGTWTNAGVQQRALIRSTDDGQTWCPLSMPGAPLSVVPGPANDLILWAITRATAPGARGPDILRSVDGGASWQAARGNLPSDLFPGTVLFVGPGSGDVAWIETTGAPGAASTQDGGRTWTRIVFPQPAASMLGVAGPIAIDPARPNRILAARLTLDMSTSAISPGLLGSVDWGVTWSDLPPPQSPVAGQPLAALMIDQASTIFAADISLPNQQMWRSKDGGTSWQTVALPAGTGPRNPSLVNGGMAGHLLISSSDDPRQQLWETINSGDSWRELALPDGFNPRTGSAVLVAGPAPGRLLISTPTGLQATTGTSSPWIARAVLPAMASAIAVSPLDPDVIWAVTSGQSLRSSDGGRTWKALPGTNRFTDVAADPADARSAFAIDLTAAFRTTDGGETWRPLAPNRQPPRRVAVAPDGKVLYVVTGTGIESSEDQGTTWAHVLDVDVLPAIGPQLAISPTDGRHAVVLAAQRAGSNSAFVIETRDAGATVASTTSVPGLAGQLQFTSIALLENDVILIGGQSGVLRSTDGGANWAESNRGIAPGAPRALPGTPIWSILAPPASPSEVWVIDGRAFRSLDAGAGWMAWPTPVALMPSAIQGLTALAGDPRPGKRLLALTIPQGSAGGPGERPNTNWGTALLELRP